MKKCFFGSAGTLRGCVSCLQRVQILLLCVSLSSCHCSGQKSAQTSIVLHPDLLPLQAALPNISALCRVFKIHVCHPSAMIRGLGVKTTPSSLNCPQLPPFFGPKKKIKWAVHQLIQANRPVTVKEDMPQRGSKQLSPHSLNGATCWHGPSGSLVEEQSCSGSWESARAERRPDFCFPNTVCLASF